jgi:tartrate/fumarate subfamily iron-sulfur-dependent hydro-lyase beta chain
LKVLNLPPDDKELRTLSSGEEVLLTGRALTMRDAAHGRLADLVNRGEEPPFSLAGQLVFYAGPSPAAAGRPVGAIGPTTSARMDRFLELTFTLGVRATLGKGPRAPQVRELHERYGAVYLAAVGGAAAVLGGLVEEIEPVAWEDLGPEAVYRVMLREFPAVVAIDVRGRDFLSEQYLHYGGQK